MFKRLIALLLAVFVVMHGVRAERPDSLSCRYDHAFNPLGLIAPTSLIVTGSVITATPLHRQWDMSLRDAVVADDHRSLHFDNYIQYLPAATPFILNVCGVKGVHGYRDLFCLTAGSYLMGAATLLTLKYVTHVERPYGGVFNSFPSGHTFTAFVGAEIIRREYGEDYPYIAVAGYLVATVVGAMRIYNNCHWASDVLAGAGLGILSTSACYWLAPYLRF